MVAAPEIARLPMLVAVIVTLCSEVIEAGALYSPALLMLPTPAGLLDQLTPAVPAFAVVR